MKLIDQLFLAIRSSPFCYRFTLFTRLLLAAGFIPPGMVKLLGHRFTEISVENPIGAFFEAMYQTGFYWNFLGLSQVLAGLLLLCPRFAHLGAALFLPIIVNVFLITVSIPFGGTPFVTGPMLLAVVYLCIWDFHRFRPIFSRKPFEATIRQHKLDFLEKVGFTVWACSIIGLFASLRFVSLFEMKLAGYAMIIGLAAGVLTLLRFVWVKFGKRLEFEDRQCVVRGA